MTIRSSILAVLAFSACAPAFAASRIESRVGPISHADEVRVGDLKKLKHPWAKDRPLPTSLADCGLEADAKLVVSTIYLDGGSRLFVLKDSKGAYFVYCTSKPHSQAKRDGDTDWNEHLVVGAKHYLDKGGVAVPRGSPTETFLLKIISGRISHAP